jgi:Flp pilus assembly protein TadG
MIVRFLSVIWRRDEGSALIEGALIVPVLMTLVFGVYEFSWYFYNQQLMTAGLRDAARYISRMADPSDATCGQATYWPLAKNLATTSTTSGSGAARVSGWTSGNVTISCVVAPTSTGVYVVNVSTAFSGQSLGFYSILGLAAPTVTVFQQERVIGPG